MEHFKIESVGMDFSPCEEIKILNPDEQGIGEIAVKGPMVMQGYYNMPYETAEMFTKDGFLKTGDLGWMDKEHYLMLSGRAKNLIVTEGGKNVYPEEIEDAFQLEYDVEQIMVRGYVANEETKSEQIEALVYPSDDLLARLEIDRANAAKDKRVYDEIKLIVDKINKGLQPYARVSKITILDKALEMTTTRKIKRGSVAKAEPKKAAPEKKAAAPKAKTPAKKAAAKKAAAKKPAATKTPAKKAAAPKTKVPAKKNASKVKKPAAKKPASKPKTAAKPAAKKPAAKSKAKPATKAKPAAKKPAAKKPAAKKPASKPKAAAKKAPAKAKAKKSAKK